MPLYGRGWIIANSQNSGFYAAATDSIQAGNYTREKGFWGYNEVGKCSNVKKIWFDLPLLMDRYASNSGPILHGTLREMLAIVHLTQ